MSDVTPVRRALLAVYDKQGVVDLARALVEMGVTLVSSGGTAATLSDAGLPVTPVDEVTGSPEMLGGREDAAPGHPRGHPRRPAETRARRPARAARHRAVRPGRREPVPFRETVASGAGFEDVIEKIDIGGPAMVRAPRRTSRAWAWSSIQRYDGVVGSCRTEG